MWPDESGNWMEPVVSWVDPTGTTPQNGPQVQANDVLTQSTVTNGPDRWGGWLMSLADKGVTYAIAKDAAKNGMVPSTTPNGQPVYSAGAAASLGAINSKGLLVIGGAVVVALLLVAMSNKG